MDDNVEIVFDFVIIFHFTNNSIYMSVSMSHSIFFLNTNN